MRDNGELLSLYIEATEERKRAQALEFDLFNELHAAAEEVAPGRRSLAVNGFRVEFKARENTKVDAAGAGSLLNKIKTGEVKIGEFQGFPFRLRYEVERGALNLIKEKEPQFYAAHIAPVLTVTPGKPTVEIKE